MLIFQPTNLPILSHFGSRSTKRQRGREVTV